MASTDPPIEDDCDDLQREPRYRSVEEMDPNALTTALGQLAGFSENPWLVMQGHQLQLVDNLLNDMEQHVLRHLYDDDRPLEAMMLLAALSPMWIYAAYELLRTWRQRCAEVMRLAASGGIDTKAEHLEREKELSSPRPRDACGPSSRGAR